MNDLPAIGEFVVKRGLGWNGITVKVNNRSGWVKVHWSNGPYRNRAMYCSHKELITGPWTAPR